MADSVHRMPPFLNTTGGQANISHVGRPPWLSGSATGARPPWLSRGTEGGVYTTVKYLNLIGNPLLYILAFNWCIATLKGKYVLKFTL